MSTTKPDTDTAGLRHAISEMNEQPDISAADSPRLKELCRVTAMEIKAVGGVGAATSLEMIGYIRELERSQVGENDHVAWCRYTHNSEGCIQSIVTCNSDAKGAFKVYRAAPSDFEQLIRLRKAAGDSANWIEAQTWACQHEDQPMRCTRCATRAKAKELVAALREALAHNDEKGTKS